ncbi:MAG: hypothetical protein ABIO55_02570 [Ginsengibacter sp.]
MSAIKSPAQAPLPGQEQALKVFAKSKDREEKSNMAFALGYHFWSARKLSQAKQWFNTCLALTPVATDSNNVVNVLHLLANVYLNEAAYDSALFFCNKSFAAVEQIKNKYYLPNLYQTKGRIYMPLGDQVSAYSFYYN